MSSDHWVRRVPWKFAGPSWIVQALSTNRAMIRRAQRVVVVADGTKVGHATLARIDDLAEVDELVTDASAPADEVEALRAAGLTVTVAGG